MKTSARPTAVDATPSQTAVQSMLRDIGYALWLSRLLAAEMKAEKCQPVRPEMSDFCAVDAAAFAA